MKLPSIEEINPTGDPLDGKDAVLDFHGKSLLEAEELFRDDGLRYSSNFYWMGPTAFLFYFKAALNYLRDTSSAGDPDFLNSMLGVLESRILSEYNDFDDLKSGTEDFITFCQHAIDNYDSYDADPTIYVDLRPRLQRLTDNLRG